MKYLKTFNEITESEQFDSNDRAVDESFFRLPSAIIGNELYAAYKNLNSFYDNANAGNDIDTSVLDSIIKKLSMIKKSAKKFNNPEEVKGTVFELNEAVQIDTSRYERTHGKKPRGTGMWAFYFDRTGGDAMFIPSAMTYPDAVNWAKGQAKDAGKSVVYVGESGTMYESFDVSGISRQDLREILNLLDSNDISYDFDGREEILDFDLTELGKKDQDLLKKLGITESAINEQSVPLGLKGIKINKKNPITFVLEISFLIDSEVVISYLTAGTQEEAKELKNKIEKAFNAEKIFSPSQIGYYAYVGESMINEEKYTVIDPKGNQMGASDKMQAISIAKKNGGETAGYFVVSNKNALKARRALEKFKGDFKDPELKDMMADLYESVNEALNAKDLPTWLFDDPSDFEDWYEGGMELENGIGKLAALSSADEKKLLGLVRTWADAEEDYSKGRGDYGTGKTTGARSASYTAQDDIKKFLTQKGKIVDKSVNEAKFKSPDYIISTTPASSLPPIRLAHADVSVGLKMADKLKNYTLNVRHFKLVHANGKVALKLTPEGKTAVRVRTENDPKYLQLIQKTVNDVISDYVSNIKESVNEGIIQNHAIK